MSYQQEREEIIALVEEGQSLDGFDKLRLALAYPAPLSSEEISEALLIFGQIAEDFDDPELSGMARATAGRVEDSDALYAFAHAAFERQLHVMAVAALARADRLCADSPEIVCELCANLDALNLHHDARALLAKSQLGQRHPLCRYLLAYHTLMTGEVETARALTAELEEAEPDIQLMVRELQRMLARADAVAGHTALDAVDLRGWHAVINGSVLLHLSPYGLDEAMHGRYAYVSDSYALIREGLNTLAAALSAAGLRPPEIWALPERSSRIVACAAGQLLGLPVHDFPEQGGDQPGIIVAYDLDAELPGSVLEALSVHRPGQILWAHGSCWTNVFPYAPDVTTFLYQLCASPWGGGGMEVDPESGEATELAPDMAPIEEIAARIVKAKPDEAFLDATTPVIALVKALAALPEENAAGLFRASGPRTRQRVGSAVLSNRFV